MISHIDRLREKLRSGQICLGTGVTFTDPTVTESLAARVDFLWIDLEHNPTNLETMQAHLIAARAGGTAALVRVPSGEIGWVKRVLDTGAEGIILPQAADADAVRAFVSACRYPPMGTRGFGPRRPSRYGELQGDEYLQHANRHVFTAVQIETREALEQVEEIAAIEGLDSVALGPNDLSGAIGQLGHLDDPKVNEAIRRVADAAHAAGKSCGAGLGASVEYAETLAELGVDWLQIGNDFEYMNRFAVSLFDAVRERVLR